MCTMLYPNLHIYVYLYFYKKLRTKPKSSNVKRWLHNAAIDSFDAHPIFMCEFKIKRIPVKDCHAHEHFYAAKTNVPFKLI